MFGMMGKWPLGNLMSAPKRKATCKASVMLLPYPKLYNRDCLPLLLKGTGPGGRRLGSCFNNNRLDPLGESFTSGSPGFPISKMKKSDWMIPKVSFDSEDLRCCEIAHLRPPHTLVPPFLILWPWGFYFYFLSCSRI